MNDYLKLFKDHPEKTCFILKNEEILFSSIEHGVKPILDYYHEFENSKTDLIVVDKIVGRGAIVLARLINATSIITPIISKDALELARFYKMFVAFETEVDYIINRTHDGRCPIESSVLGITDYEKGYKTIIDTLKNLSNKN